jgi:hypothetical protein
MPRARSDYESNKHALDSLASLHDRSTCSAALSIRIFIGTNTCCTLQRRSNSAVKSQQQEEGRTPPVLGTLLFAWILDSHLRANLIHQLHHLQRNVEWLELALLEALAQTLVGMHGLMAQSNRVGEFEPRVLSVAGVWEVVHLLFGID